MERAVRTRLSAVLMARGRFVVWNFLRERVELVLKMGREKNAYQYASSDGWALGLNRRGVEGAGTAACGGGGGTCTTSPNSFSSSSSHGCS